MNPSHLSFLEFSRSGGGGETQRTKTGGRVVKMLASGTLLIGDIVYVSADNTVAKSAVAATFADKLIGVVVGGTKFAGGIPDDYSSASVGLTAAVDGEEVYVMIQGVGYIIADGVIAAGLPFSASIATAGRATAGNTNARIVGKILVASGTNGDVRLALIGWG